MMFDLDQSQLRSLQNVLIIQLQNRIYFNQMINSMIVIVIR